MLSYLINIIKFIELLCLLKVLWLAYILQEQALKLLNQLCKMSNKKSILTHLIQLRLLNKLNISLLNRDINLFQLELSKINMMVLFVFMEYHAKILFNGKVKT